MTIDTNWENFIEEELSRLSFKNLERKLYKVSHPTNTETIYEGKEVLNFASSNYLGLAGHPEINKAMKDALDKHGTSTTASRLITGHTTAVEKLEKQIASFKETEAALLFSNGYMTNLGVISALLGRHDVVISDRLNHASIVDGIRISGAQHYRYRHMDSCHLETMLKKAIMKGFRKVLIVTDTVFSMDGDSAKLDDILYLKDKYGAALMLDEAHAEGAIGPFGRGLAYKMNVHKETDLHMGTFSKAFGVYGGYIAGKRTWIKFILNKSRSFIYTTSLPPSIIGGISASIPLVKKSETARRQLDEKSIFFRKGLIKLGIPIGNSNTHIVPVMFDNELQAINFSKKLLEFKVLGVPIRPPTVTTARVRLTLMATHSIEQISRAIKAIEMAYESVRGESVLYK